MKLTKSYPTFSRVGLARVSVLVVSRPLEGDAVSRATRLSCLPEDEGRDWERAELEETRLSCKKFKILEEASIIGTTSIDLFEIWPPLISINLFS